MKQLEKDTDPQALTDKLLQLTEKHQVTQEMANFISSLFICPEEVVGAKVLHTWYYTDTDVDETYVGTILKKKKTKKVTYVVAYFNELESVDAAADYDIDRSQFTADALFADLHIMSNET